MRLLLYLLRWTVTGSPCRYKWRQRPRDSTRRPSGNSGGKCPSRGNGWPRPTVSSWRTCRPMGCTSTPAHPEVSTGHSLLYTRLEKVYSVIGKGKTVSLQACSGPEGSRKLRYPDFMTMAQDGGKVISLTHRPPLPQEIHLVLISVRGWVDPKATVRPEELCQWKIPMTASRIEPATCRFVA